MYVQGRVAFSGVVSVMAGLEHAIGGHVGKLSQSRGLDYKPQCLVRGQFLNIGWVLQVLQTTFSKQ